MTRKTKIVKIEMEGRDKGKEFLLTEMPAVQAEKWANRALAGICRANPDLPIDLASAGMSGFAVLGLRALMSISWTEAEPLLDEMFECIQVQPPSGIPRGMIEGDIEEVATRLWLRSEVLELHSGFSVAAGLSSLASAVKSMAASSRIRTSQPESAPS